MRIKDPAGASSILKPRLGWLLALFTPFEVAAVGVSSLIVGQIARDGRSNWLEGAQLVAAYLIIAISFFFVSAG